jgi:hypothetical protein
MYITIMHHASLVYMQIDRERSHHIWDDSPQVLNKVHTGAMELVSGAPLQAARACGVRNAIGVPEQAF